jgi:transposase
MITKTDVQNKPTIDSEGHLEGESPPVCDTTSLLQEEIDALHETIRSLRIELIGQRQEAHYRKSLHLRAVARETALKEKVKELEATVQALIEKLKGYEELKAKYNNLKELHFGRKSEHKDSSGEDESTPPTKPPKNPGKDPEKSRGQQPGTTGHGRKNRGNLPTEEIIHDVPETEKCCPLCGEPFKEFPKTEPSEEIHIEIKVIRRLHKRKCYKPTCNCGAVPGIVIAPKPHKLIPKGLFSIGFWVWVLMEKFYFQRPFNRVREVLALQGCMVSQGTLTGGLRKIEVLIQPLYVKILEKSRMATHWHMDETRWMVFEEIEGKKGHRWWLWVVVTKHTCCFMVDPTRSSEIPCTHLGGGIHGTLSVDRYSAYKVLAEKKKIKLAFCWAHVRRDFLRVGKGYEELFVWSEEWRIRIDNLFLLNHDRCKFRHEPGKFDYRQRKLRTAINEMERQLDHELAGDLHSEQKKVLSSLKNHWEGLTLFVKDPDIPMDNNEAERALRNAVVGRKNFYGNGAVWTSQVTAYLYTIFETVKRCGINPQKYLTCYFEACAQNGGKPPENLDAFLPWSFSEEIRSKLKEDPP